MIIKTTQYREVTHLKAICQVRYWEDATVNGVEDENGDLMPCREGDNWCPIINLESGRIINWDEGTTASVHYKVCDAGVYQLKDEHTNVIKEIEGYVPSIMYPKEEGFGDYVIMDIDKNGYIKDWITTLDGFDND